MTTVSAPPLISWGFRVLGPTTGLRKPVDWSWAFRAYASCDPRAEVNREAYLSAFTFDESLRGYLKSTGSTKGFDGACTGAWMWFDQDGTNLDAVLADTRRLVTGILERYRGVDEDDLLLFFSGSKGTHVGVPIQPSLSANFHRIVRRLAEGLAAMFKVTIDTSVYDKVRLFRAPNSRHQKSGLFKRRLAFKELMYLDAAHVRELAKEPEYFDVPAVTTTDEQAVKDWQDASQLVERENEVKAERRAAVANGTATINQLTWDFIRNGAAVGDRHRLLFSAAANLAEFNCPPALAHALLTEVGLDTGLPPNEVRRQIDCGLAHVKGANGHA